MAFLFHDQNQGILRPRQQGLRHGEPAMSPCRWSQTGSGKIGDCGGKPDSSRANSARRTRMRRIRFRFVLVLTIMTREELWTSVALLVDGLPGRLGGFRKSPHFIPAGPGLPREVPPTRARAP